MEQYFSAATNELLAKAQEVAEELRYSEVTTFSLFLAQCLLDKDQLSIGSLVYKDKADFQRFYTAQRLIFQYHFPDFNRSASLPLAEEMSTVISQSVTEMEKFGHTAVLPAHLFLAAFSDVQSVLCRMVSPTEHLYERVVEFYTAESVIRVNKETPPEHSKQKGWFSRLFSMQPDTGPTASLIPLKIGLSKGYSDVPVSRYETNTDFEKTEVEIAALSHSQEQPGTYAIVFKEKEGQRIVPLVVGGYEAEQLYIALERPDEHKKLVVGVLNEVVNRLGYQVLESVVYGRKSGVFLTRIILSNEQGLLAVEARPSDAIALSVISATPFTFARSVFDIVSVIPGATESDSKDENKPE
jgi:uncharacterized protein